ncbi:MAG: ArdC family protein [Azoarcus sp.]|nr:ArdC family protein [Azoarcus sp.]
MYQTNPTQTSKNPKGRDAAIQIGARKPAKTRKQSGEYRRELAAQALGSAVNGQSLANYPAILDGFMEKGIPVGEIKPRENVFTFNAWRALGRVVRRGEHGVQILTFIECKKENPESGEPILFRKPRTSTVFHVSQTDPLTA